MKQAQMYSLEELAEHHNKTGSVVSRYVRESDYLALIAERDALAAQLNFMREAYAELIQNGGTTYRFKEILDKSPAACLAQVKADAAEKAIRAVLNEVPTFTGKNGSWLIKSIAWDKVLPLAKSYPERIRQGGE